MALREFVDSAGEVWRVWDTVPLTTSGLTGDYRGGWLTFDNGLDRRRLAPVPLDWVLMSDERLRLLLRVALRRERAETRDAERRSGERRQADRRQGDRREARHAPPETGSPPPEG